MQDAVTTRADDREPVTRRLDGLVSGCAEMVQMMDLQPGDSGPSEDRTEGSIAGLALTPGARKSNRLKHRATFTRGPAVTFPLETSEGCGVTHLIRQGGQQGIRLVSGNGPC